MYINGRNKKMAKRRGARGVSLAVILSMAMSLFVVPQISAGAASAIQIGTYVQMGTYYGEPILWRCVDIDENGPLMLADKILTIKPFDGAGSDGSGSRDSKRATYGSNYWADSDIRSWLNSDEENVTWLDGAAPTADKVWNGYNSYADEAGFLTNFSSEEKALIKEVTQKSLVSQPEVTAGAYSTGSALHTYNVNISDVLENYSSAYAEYVTDKMFLLDVKQINAVYNNGGQLGENYYIGEPTESAVENSEYKTNDLAVGKKYCSWLRTPHGTYSYITRALYSDGALYDSPRAYGGDVGVRPAFYLDTTAANFSYGSGTLATPFKMDTVTPASSIQLGQYVQMGSYYGEPILWRCVGFQKVTDGVADPATFSTTYQAGYQPLMMTDKIIMEKSFSPKQTNDLGSYARGDANRDTWGSHYWGDSTLRQWLNSDAQTISWLNGNAPDVTHVRDSVNPYDTEAGFLTNFTDVEKKAMKTVTQKNILSSYDSSVAEGGSETHTYNYYIGSTIQNYDDCYYEYDTDTMFVLDIRQNEVVYQNSDVLGSQYHVGELTEAAVENSDITKDILYSWNWSGKDVHYAGNKWYTWLRSPYSGNSYGVRYVYLNGGVSTTTMPSPGASAFAPLSS